MKLRLHYNCTLRVHCKYAKHQKIYYSEKDYSQFDGDRTGQHNTKDTHMVSFDMFAAPIARHRDSRRPASELDSKLTKMDAASSFVICVRHSRTPGETDEPRSRITVTRRREILKY